MDLDNFGAIIHKSDFGKKCSMSDILSLKLLDESLTNGGLQRCQKGSFVKKENGSWYWAFIMGHCGRKWDFHGDPIYIEISLGAVDCVIRKGLFHCTLYSMFVHYIM